MAVLFGNGGNIGVSYGADGTLIVDDQFAPLVPQDPGARSPGSGASPVKFLVNTHWHFDHAGGNENFGKAGAIIVAQTRVRDRLAAGGTVAGNNSPPAPKEALPIVTYDHGMSFHLNGDTIDVIHTGGGHTDGDTVVFWRKANVLHTGDMMMNGRGFPFVDLSSGGNVEHLLVSLDQLIAMTDADTVIIPGHGPLAHARRPDRLARDDRHRGRAGAGDTEATAGRDARRRPRPATSRSPGLCGHRAPRLLPSARITFVEFAIWGRPGGFPTAR